MMRSLIALAFVFGLSVNAFAIGEFTPAERAATIEYEKAKTVRLVAWHKLPSGRPALALFVLNSAKSDLVWELVGSMACDTARERGVELPLPIFVIDFMNLAHDRNMKVLAQGICDKK